MTKVSFLLKKATDIAQDKQLRVGEDNNPQVTIQLPNVLGNQSNESYEVIIRIVDNQKNTT